MHEHSGLGSGTQHHPLTCRVRQNDELCTGTFDMWTNGSHTWDGSMKVSRALDRNATWPW